MKTPKIGGFRPSMKRYDRSAAHLAIGALLVITILYATTIT